MEATTFLLECTSQFPNVEEISEQLLLKEEEDDRSSVTEKENPSWVLPNNETEICVSCIQPRSKLQLSLSSNQLQLVSSSSKSPKRIIQVSSDQVEYIVQFPNPHDCQVHHNLNARNGTAKKPAGTIALLVFKKDSPVIDNKKKLTQICMTIPQECNDWFSAEICKALEYPIQRLIQVHCPISHPIQLSEKHNVFWSETKRIPFVSCYHHVNDGHVFPLKQGILFFKYVFIGDIRNLFCFR